MSARSISILSLLVWALSIAPLAAEEKRTAAPLFGHTSTIHSFGDDFDLNQLPAPPLRRPPGISPAVAPRTLRFASQAEPPATKGQSPERENWIRKHPAKFGALVGATIGTVPAFHAMATCPPTRSCSTAGAGVLFGGMTGAAIGAFTGWVISKAK